QSPLFRRSFQRIALFIQEGAAGPGNCLELALALVEVERVGFALLDNLDLTIGAEESSKALLRRHADVPIDNARRDLWRRGVMACGGDAIVRHVEIEVPV